MSMREMRLKYFISLASNIDAKANHDAQVVAQANKKMQEAVQGTNAQLDKLGKTQDAFGTGVERNTSRVQRMDRELVRLGATTDGTAARTAALERVYQRLGANSSTERQIGYMRRLGDAIDQVQAKARRLGPAIAKGLEHAPEVAAGVAAGAYGAKRVTAPFIAAYANLETATQDLKVAMLDKNGNVPPEFAQIAATAKALGERLPGGTKDFMLGARALVEQGISPRIIANGGLQASSNFGALMGMDQYASATTIAKVREAHALKEDQLVSAADLMQRGRYAFGIAPTDYLEVAKYAAPTYNTMNLGGIDKMRELLAVQGLAAQVGLEASSFGTNFSMMLTNAAKFDTRLNKGSKEAKEVRAMLKEHGIHMEFFNKKGEWAGTENMMAQLEKLNGLSDQDKIKVANRLFGVEAGRPAMTLGKAGVAGYREALGKIDSQANLDQRIEMKLKTFAAKKEAMEGGIENAMAQAADQSGNALKPVMDKVSDLMTGPVQKFLEDHPAAGTAGLAAGGATGAWLLGSGVQRLFQWLRGSAAGPVAGGAGVGAPSGGAVASAPAAAGNTRGLFVNPPAAAAPAMGLRGLLARMGLAGAGLSLAGDLFTTSDEEIAILKQAEARRRGGNLDLPENYRGKGFTDPRLLLTQGMDMEALLRVTAPGSAPQQAQAGQPFEVKIGEGVLRLDINVHDNRVEFFSAVQKPMDAIRIDGGSTNPGGLK